MAYTATPYANIFIDHEATSEEFGDDLFPKDFIYALDAPSNYFGARRVFLDTEDQHLLPIPTTDLDLLPLRHKKDTQISRLPESLYEAIRLFLINTGIRSIRGQGNKHNSMLVHASRFTLMHEQLGPMVQGYLRKLRTDFSSFGMLRDGSSQSSLIADVRDTCEKILGSVDETDDWLSVSRAITETISSVIVREVHQNSVIPIEYRSDIPSNVIAVGGASLSRGFTLEGLSVSYFMRNTVFYDTLMQMGRWFGYRPGYEDLCRIYMPERTIEHFRTIIEATEDLIGDLKVMAENNLTPNDFGLAVRQHPDSALQVTARNKQKHVHEFYFDMKLDGHLKETAYLPAEESHRAANFTALSNLLSRVGPSSHKVGRSHLWRDQPREIVADFLNQYKVFSRDKIGLSTRMPIGFIKQYVQERKTLWDIALYGGEGDPYSNSGLSIQKERRSVSEKNGGFEVKQRQVSSGNSESISLDAALRTKLGNDRRAIRAVEPKNPLLMLHVLQTNEGDFSAFGVSFPGSAASPGETVKLKINTVFYKDLLKELEEEEAEAEEYA